MKVGGIFTALKTTFSGLSTQMKRMEIISENIANAEKLPGPDEKVYSRKTVIESTEMGSQGRRFREEMSLSLRKSRSGHISTQDKDNNNHRTGIRYKNEVEVVEVEGEKLIYNPTHPRADENGYVKMPNVNIVEEMVDMIAASRSYEANISVMTAAKQMAKKAMEI